MLANATVTALVGTMQKEASTAFYRDTLGLKFITDDGFASVFEGKNARVRVSRVPAITPATYAVLAFQVCEDPLLSPPSCFRGRGGDG